MKQCPICGCFGEDSACFCTTCGTKFAEPQAPVSEPQQVPTAEEIPPVLEPSDSDRKQNRMAVAGFVLSLIGVQTCLTTPLQITALVLSLVSKPKRTKAFRIIGIIVSAVSLAGSLFLWAILIANGDAVLAELYEAMYF